MVFPLKNLIHVLLCSHILRFSNSEFEALVISVISLAECARQVSPAYIVTFRDFMAGGGVRKVMALYFFEIVG